MNYMNNHIQEQILDDILNQLRPYFEAERDLNERIPNCETEADLYARQRATLLAQARETLRSQLEAVGIRF